MIHFIKCLAEIEVYGIRILAFAKIFIEVYNLYELIILTSNYSPTRFMEPMLITRSLFSSKYLITFFNDPLKYFN